MKKSILVFLFAFFLGAYPMSSFAIVGTYPFGGNITAVIPCTCTKVYLGQSKLIIVGPPRPGTFLYIPEIPLIPGAGTDLRAFFSLLPGSYALGLSTLVPIACMQEAVTGCFPSGFGAMMIMVGTSMPI